jgi:hypothetical protein
MQSPTQSNKIYIAMVGSAPMASLDALLISLDRFKNALSSDSARENFETAVRTIQPDLKSVHAFVDAVYAKKDPKFQINLRGRTLVVEINLSSNDFYECIHDQDIEEILTHVTAVGSMPADKTGGFKTREYTVFPVKYLKGQFVKTSSAF